MIRSYSDHAANERTFLAWVRTGIAVIAFGFVVERFNLFLRSLAVVAAGDATPRLPLRLLGPLGRGEGVVLIVGGTLLIAMATVRFVRTTRLIDDPGIHAASSVRAELILSAALLVVLAGFSIYLLLG